MNSLKLETEQEKFWAGEFGDEYCERDANKGEFLKASNIASFSTIFSHTRGVKSIVEFGANTGMNLVAIRDVMPETELSVIELNARAVDKLKKNLDIKNVYHKSLLDFIPERKWDLVLIKGVLIHINPDFLDKVYKNLYDSSDKYILISEYYNPTPVMVKYRGHENRLFKRDFAGEMLDRYPDLELINYGFEYNRDNNYFYDDLNWFLLKK